MANINLLPWREEERAERQRQFISILGLVAMLGVVVMWSIYSFYSNENDNQRGRNNYLQGQIRQLDTRIKEITTLETERKELVDRMDLIQNLQKSRPQIVHLFDEIVQKLPEGINMTEISRKNDDVIFIGVAESAPRISNFMRSLAGSEWVSKPDIDDISDEQSSGSGRKSFTLKSKITTPKTSSEEAK